MSADIVCFGELLWDMLPSGKVIGGAPFNITNRANALGMNAFVITSIGDDALGVELLSAVSQKVDNTQFIQQHPSLPTSVVNIEVGPRGEPHYDIVHPVAWDDIVISPEIKQLVQSSKTFIYSSLGLRDERARDALFSLLPQAQLKICDINLRDGHFIQSTIMRMIEAADILRMNETELEMIAHWLNIENLNQEDQIRYLFDQYQYQEVIATLGGDGAILYDGTEFMAQPVFPVEVKDTVGAGDAFLATYISKKLQGIDPKEALRVACAVGSLTASKHGGTPEITDEEIKKILTNNSN